MLPLERLFLLLSGRQVHIRKVLPRHKAFLLPPDLFLHFRCCPFIGIRHQGIQFPTELCRNRKTDVTVHTSVILVYLVRLVGRHGNKQAVLPHDKADIADGKAVGNIHPGKPPDAAV